MPKAKKKSTTPAKRATPDPIVKLINEAEGALYEYRNAETAVEEAVDRRKSAYEALARITKEVSQGMPTTAAGALAIIEYASERSEHSVREINCIKNDAHLHQLLWRARRALMPTR